jgi:uncharacterized membrane protein YqjE
LPLIDEHVRAVGREVRDLARLHAELARVEVQSGSRRLVTGLFLLWFGVMMGALVLAAFGIAFFAWFRTLVSTPVAAAIVGLVFTAVMLGSWFFGWRLLRSSGDLLMPRSRTMLLEMLGWHNEQTSSSEKSARGDGD